MFRVFALLCALATTVHAKLMTHTDLAGLALDSDAVILADRTSPGHYRVIKVLRGKAATGELVLEDSLYDLPPRADARCWLFVKGTWLASLRVVADGKVFRFEQRNNPGGWDPVPQGQDPAGEWRTTPQLDVAGFEKALAAAFARADAVTAAIATQAPRDRLLALLAPAGDARASGFYVDEVAAAIEGELARRRDWFGAIVATQHDHRGVDVPRFRGHAKDLLAVARDAAQPEAVRARAVREAGADFSIDGDYLPLLADASAVVRAEAVHAAARRSGAMSSDPADQQKIEAQRRAAKAAFAKLASSEHSSAVFYELGAIVPIPTFAGHVSVVEEMVMVEIRCKEGTSATPLKLSAMRDGQPYELGAFNLQLACGDSLGGGVARPFPPGTYALAAEIAVGRHVEKVPLGSFAVVGGEVAIAPE